MSASYRLVVPGPRRLWRRSRTCIDVVTPDKLYVAGVLGRHGLSGYEPESLACVLAAGECAGAGWVYDVGANIGVFAFVAAAFSRRPVVAFEPTPVLAKTARDIAVRNDLRYDVEELALADSAGTATFYLSDQSDASNSLAAGFRPSSKALQVRLDTLDGYADRTGRRPAVVKVDTETTEADVLRGALRTLTTARPWVLCELLAGRREGEVDAVLLPLGYTPHHITDAPPWPARDEGRGDRCGAFRNWLYAPGPVPEAFWSRQAKWHALLRRSRVERLP